MTLTLTLLASLLCAGVTSAFAAITPRTASAGGDCDPTPDGHQYLGHTSVTKSGKQCQAWASQSPHQHSHNQDYMFPDLSVNDASNYCRNPSTGNGLWCFTTDPGTRLERCDVPACGEDCNPSPDGQHYIGHISATESGRWCQAWASQSPHQHSFNQDGMFPDGSVSDASNYCRNPNRLYQGLWCYTTDPEKEWEKCYVPRCAVPCNASNVFKCPNNDRCIRASHICDGHNTCGDRSDELNCHVPQVFKCRNNGRIIRASYVCDGHNNCGDWSDELNCHVPHVFKCPNNDRIIRVSRVCDGVNTCGDWSDELNCPCTASDLFKCPNKDRCFLRLYVCDGVDDCGDGSDELNCLAGSRGCGNPAFRPDVLLTRIVGGEEARKHSWPWHCLISGGCGSTIIDKYHILTAAHCIGSKDHIRVTCGIHDRKDPSNYITEQIINEATATVHERHTCRDFPDYDIANVKLIRPRCDYDIAVIRLPTPLRYNDYVQPVCLPNSRAAVGTKCVATGWGITRGTGDNTVLRQVILPIVSDDLCAQEGTVCAGPMVANKSTCYGDSGGPLVCKQGDKWFQYGITSFLATRSCTSRYPSGFADVVYFLPWIKKQTGSGKGELSTQTVTEPRRL